MTNRVPAFRRHLAMLAAAGIGASLLLTACTPGSNASGADASATASAGSVTSGETTPAVSAAWDQATVHSIAIDYDEADYQELMDTYLSTGEKIWISATVTIDGVTYQNVGLKLKGNSSLRGITGQEAAEDLPWIIRLDKFVEGQHHLGATEYAIRSNSSETSLNEAVALDLLEAAGLAAQQAIAVEFSAAGSAATLRLAVENPTDEWMEANLGDGYLYKAESGGSWNYVDDDPASYASSFDQEGGEENLTPLIDFLEFINTSDDAAFASELRDWLDVDAFATYLAFQQVVNNFDDIDGPGNNAYLFYDAETGQMTVVNWDLNLAFGASPQSQGVGGANAGAMPGGGAADAGGGMAPGGGMGERPDASQGGRPGAGQADQAGGQTGQTGGGMGGGMGGMSGSNVLSERFLANADFAALVDSEVDRLTELFYGSGGVAQASLDAWTAVLLEQAGDVITADAVTSESEQLASSFGAV